MFIALYVYLFINLHINPITQNYIDLQSSHLTSVLRKNHLDFYTIAYSPQICK